MTGGQGGDTLKIGLKRSFTAVTSYIGRYRDARYSLFRWRYELGVVGKVALALGMAAFTGLLAQLQVSLPLAQAPTTGQLFAALLAGVLLGRWYGGLSQVLYAVIGGAGVGWFVGWGGGVSYLTGVSGGYIVGFIVVAFVIGWLTERYTGARSFLPLLGLMLVAVGITYLFVAAWLAMVPSTNRMETLAGDAFPFIPVDLVKAAVVAAIAYLLLPKTAFSAEVAAAPVPWRQTFSLLSLRRGAKRLTRIGLPVKGVRGTARSKAEAKVPPETAPVAGAAAEETEAETPPEAETVVKELETIAAPAAAEVVEEPVAEAAPEAAPAAEAAAGKPEAKTPAQAPAEEEDTGREPTEEERNALYSGEVELALAPPLDAAVMSRLHSLLLGNPELKIMRTVGSWERGTTITVFLDRPLPLVGVLTEISELRLSTRQRPGGRGGVFAGRIAMTVKSGLAANEAAAGGE